MLSLTYPNEKMGPDVMKRVLEGGRNGHGHVIRGAVESPNARVGMGTMQAGERLLFSLFFSFLKHPSR